MHTSPLSPHAEGLWQGTAMQSGAPVQVSVDYRGEVTTQ